MKRYILKAAAVLATTVAACLLSISMPASAAPAAPVANAQKSKTGRVMKTQKNNNTFATPDFAYPADVENNAREVLDKSLASGDGGRALLALLQIDKALGVRHADATDLQAAICDSVAERLPEAYRALVWLIEAAKYSGQYSSHRWQYDRRVLPTDAPLPESCLEWSGQQYAERVTTLCRQAWDVLKDDTCPLDKVGEVITFGEATDKLLTSGWTLRDFAALRILRILDPWTAGTAWEDEMEMEDRGVIPFFPQEKAAGTEDSGAQDTSRPSVQAALLASTVVSAIEDGVKRYRTAPVVRIVFGLEKAASLSGVPLYEWLRDLYEEYHDNNTLSLYIVTPLCDAMYALPVPEAVKEGKQMTPEEYRNKEKYALCTEALERWPKSPAANNVKNARNRLADKSVNINIPSTALPGQEIKGTAGSTNVNEAQLILVKLPANGEETITVGTLRKSGRIVRTIPVKFHGKIPFNHIDTISLGELGVGRYALLPSSKGTLSTLQAPYENDRSRVSMMRVTKLAYMTAQWGSGEQQALYVVDAGDGSPVAHAVVEVFERDYRRSSNDGLVSLMKGVTDSMGCVVIPAKSDYVIINRDGDQVRGNINSSYEKGKAYDNTYARILTDRAIVRPGETLGFSAVVYGGRGREYSPLTGSAVRVVLMDANRQKVLEKELTTDKWGRVHGELVIPEGRLLGRWLVTVTGGRDGSRIGDASIRVEEYKLPTFRVIVDAPSADDITPDGVLMLKGKALTYSGMPVAGAKVEVKIDTYDNWISWWRRGVEGHCSTTLTTDVSGVFEIPLDPALLKGTPYAESTFRAQVTVTDQAGETREASPYVFSFAKTKVITPSIGSRTEVTGEEVNLKVPVYDNVGVPVQTQVRCTLTPVDIPGAKEQTCEFSSPTLTLPASSMASGRWKLSFLLPGDTEDHAVKAETLIWRMDDRTAPAGEGLWAPVTEIVAESGSDSVEFPLGSCFGDLHVMMQTVSDTGEHTEQWLTLEGVNRRISLPAPRNGAGVVSLMAWHDMQSYTARVWIVAAKETEKLEIESRTFRSAVTAGDKETWTFDIRYAGKGVDVPVMAVMTDAALNALVPFRWSFNTPAMDLPGVVGGLRSYLNRGSQYYWIQYTSPRWLKESRLPQPDFRWYSRWAGTDGIVYATGMVNEMYEATSADMDSFGAVMEEKVAAPMAAPNGMMMKSRSMAQASAKMESASDDSVAEVESESADAGNGGDEGAPDVELRPSELPVAFFRPDLESNPDGTLTLDVDVPNYNTTWQLQILGYTPDMKSAVKVLETTASKVVMVRSHTPRYLRTGDKCVITATVYNNSDAPAAVGGLMEIVTTEGKVIARKKHKAQTLEAMESRVISIEVDVPDDVMQLYVRAYALGDRHSDGEETLLEVLPATLPVTESTPFWLAPGQDRLEIKLPDYSRRTQVTLSYCANPVWTCLTAMPDLMDSDTDNVLSLGRALFANGMGTGLLKANPAMARGLKEMLAASDSVLVSNLEKDSGLKTVALPATPWLDDAIGETSRMKKLGTLLDGAGAQAAQKALVDRLWKLQNADGSWAWMPGMAGSRWITGQTLLKMGMLNVYGYLPEADGRCGEMIRKGAAYTERAMVSRWREYGVKAFSAGEMVNWLYVRQICEAGDLRIDDVEGYGEIRDWGYKAIAAEWRDLDIYDKATAATVLFRHGDGATARAILESLTQTALRQGDKGMWFDRLENDWTGWPPLITTAQALEAYALISPEAPEVDQLRQWLVLQRQVQDWGSDSYASEVINAVLTCGTKWEATDAMPEIRVGNRLIVPDSRETLTGAFTVHIDGSDASGRRLAVTRAPGATGPAWGGVIRQYVAPPSDVKPEAIPTLSVRKEIVKVVDADGVDNGVAKGRGAELHVGDKVRVTLTVVCDRAMDYVALTDPRPSCLEPVASLSGYTAIDGVWVYRETRNTDTNLYFDYLPKGTHVYSYECRVSHEGEFAVGPATVQSQYAPTQTAHSAGMTMEVKD